MMRRPQRVVTGWSEQRRAVVLFAGALHRSMSTSESAQASELWVTDETPAATHLARRCCRPASGSSTRRRAAAPSASSPTQPGAEVDLHATETLDYIVVVSGELTLVLPDEEVTLRAGDTLVQQATPARLGEPHRANRA